MRFIYGMVFGVMASVIGAILYLAFADGQYLLQLSPRYHEMRSTIAGLQEAKQQRDALAARLEKLTAALDDLTRRFNELRETGCGPAATHPGPIAGEPSAAPRAAESPSPTLPPTPKPTPKPHPAVPTVTAAPTATAVPAL
jgi:hypothetical protein